MNWRDRFDKDLKEEMQFHLDQSKQDHQDQGLPENEAKQAAKRAFGNQTSLHERTWQATGYAPLERIAQDLKYAARSCKRNPGFSLSVVLLLGLAIWMCTTCFTVIQAVMLAPLPFDKPESLVRLYETNPSKGVSSSDVSPANFVDWRNASHAFSEMAAFLPEGVRIDDEVLPVAIVTKDFFSVLRVSPLLGRTFLDEDLAPPLRDGQKTLAGITSVVISHAFWKRHFRGDPLTVGSTMQIGDAAMHQVVQIIGVLPEQFNTIHMALNTQMGHPALWLARSQAENQMPEFRELRVIARLRTGVSLGQAQAEMKLIAGRLNRERPIANAGWGVRVADLRDGVPGSYRTALTVMGWAVVLVLLIACANAGNMMLVRGAARLREMATRTAIGAGRGRLVVQLATESVFLSLLAGGLGFALSLASLRAVVALAPPDLPRIGTASINLTVFGFCMLIALATGLLCSLLPSLRLSNLNLNTVLKEGGTISPTGSRGLLSRSLVVIEVAMSLVLLVGAALLAKGFAKTQAFQFGLNARSVVALRLSQMDDDLLLALERVPGVVTLSVGGVPPWAVGHVRIRIDRDDESLPAVTDGPGFQYFRILGIPTLSGRLFTESEKNDRSVVVVNKTAARMWWPNEPAIGKRIDLGSMGFARVVGVVDDIPNVGLQRPPMPQFYVPPGVNPDQQFLVMRTAGPTAEVIRNVRVAIQRHNSRIKIRSLESLDVRIARETAGLTFNTLLMSVFAGLAFLLAVSGVYSLMSYTVALRMREVSIRMALGADRSTIIALVVKSGAILAGLGVTLGLCGAMGLTRYLKSMLFQVEPLDGASFGLAVTLLVMAALTACYIPARRAGGCDVVKILRQD